jgi:hypothetical protein
MLYAVILEQVSRNASRQTGFRVLFCRAFYPKTGLILSLSKDPLSGTRYRNKGVE